MIEVDRPFTYATLPGNITCNNISAGSAQAGLPTTYTLALTMQNPITANYSLLLIFPASSFSLPNTTYTCLTTLSPTCIATLSSSNSLTLTNIVSPSSMTLYSSISITIS